MRAINHAMTGAILGLSIANPVALPLAFVSHYVLDGLPHHGEKDQGITSNSFRIMLVVDTILCAALVIVIGLKHPEYWWLAIICAFVAASPDFMWARDFLNGLKGKPRKDPKTRHQLVMLHSQVQWFQKPVGILVEVVWAIAAVIFLSYLVGA